MKRTKRLQQNIRIFIKNNCVRFCFVCIFTAFLYVNIMLINYWMKLEMTNSYNNTPYNAFAVTFLMDGQNPTLLDLSVLAKDNMLEECVLFRYNPEAQAIYEVIYCSPNAICFNHPVSWDWDFTSKEQLAVVGIDSEYQYGDSILKSGKTYPVKGVLDRHICEAVNYGIFYTNCSLDALNLNESYVLTSSKNTSVKKAFAKLEEYLQGQDITIKKLDVRNTEYGDYIKYNEILLFILILLTFFYILLIFVAKKIWLLYKKPEIFVLTILGDRRPQVKAYMEYIIIWMLAFVINGILIFFTVDTFYFGYAQILFVTLGIFGMVLLSVIMMFYVDRHSV